MSKQFSTAILIFSRTAKEEAVCKTFDFRIGKNGNTAIARSLIRKTVEISKQSNLPVFTCFSSNQKGESFGERLANAIESIYEKGFENVIALGNDCPRLTCETLLFAKEKLQQNKLVLGPTPKGGVYLIGIQKSIYKRQQFIDLAWEKSDLQNTFKNYCQPIFVSIAWLETHQDINQASDFKCLLNTLPNNFSLKKDLENILASYLNQFFVQNFSFQNKTISRNLSLRAPPF